MNIVKIYGTRELCKEAFQSDSSILGAVFSFSKKAIYTEKSTTYYRYVGNVESLRYTLIHELEFVGLSRDNETHLEAMLAPQMRACAEETVDSLECILVEIEGLAKQCDNSRIVELIEKLRELL